MTVSAPSTTPPSVSESASRTLRENVRRWRFWIIVAIALPIATLIIGILGNAGANDSSEFSPANPAPNGALALVEVLRTNGITVDVVDSFARAEAAAETDSTVLFYDPNGFLPEEKINEVIKLGGSSVVMAPSFGMLYEIDSQVSMAGYLQDAEPIEARCEVPEAERAESILGAGAGYSFTESSTRQGCFGSNSDGYFMVNLAESSQNVTILGSTMPFQNGVIIEEGNASLALGLLGKTDHVLWYQPGEDDFAASGPPSLAQLTPDWVTPVMSLLAIVAIAAALWQGRRFGKVVVENLPVIVPARETMEGRARLYARAGTYTRALDSLRLGTLSRLCVALGLPKTANVLTVVQACAATLGEHPSRAEALLVSAVPASETDFRSLAAQLTQFEQAVMAARTL